MSNRLIDKVAFKAKKDLEAMHQARTREIEAYKKKATEFMRRKPYTAITPKA